MTEASMEPSLADLKIPFTCLKCGHEYDEILSHITAFMAECPKCNVTTALTATDISNLFNHLKELWGIER